MFNNYYVGDFENTTNGNETYIYGAGFMNITDSDATLFDTIDDAINYLAKIPAKSVVYFHNLSNYDSWIIIDWLARNGFYYSVDKQYKRRYTGIVTEDRKVYQLKVCFNGRYYVEFRDTALIIQGKLDTIGKNFGCPTSKLVGTIDYDKPRGVGYIMTPEERKYLRNDVVLLKEILEKALTMGDLTSYLTAGGYAFNELKHSLYKDIHGLTKAEMDAKRCSQYYKRDINETFRTVFPELPTKLDEVFRKAYRGGYCINWSDGSIYRGHGLVLDVNSLYPSVMVNNPYPWGLPTYHKGTIPNTECYIVHLETRFEVKPNKLPFIQIKNSRSFLENEYISVVDDEVELYLSSVDYELFHEMYTVYYENIIESWSFPSSTTLFNNFVLDHYEGKKNATNKTERLLHKTCLNSAYGKFGSKIVRYSANKVFIKDNGVVGMDFIPPSCKYYKNCPKACEDCYKNCKDYEPTQPSATYIPVAIFVTAYGRKKIIESACKVIEHLRYIDTDSLHLVDITVDEVAKIFDLDPKELGYFACESEFDEARWVRQKTYVERNIIEDGKVLDEPRVSIKACGLTDDGKAILIDDQEVFQKFTYGLTITGAKLMAHTVKGGKNLKRVDFNIRG